MTISSDAQFESYLPVYDFMPEKWEEARRPLVEHLKKISNAVNIREIGWFLDQEVLAGKQFIPGVLVDANFSLIDLWGAATDAVAFTGMPINQPNITYDATNINITASAAFTRAFAMFEYMQEL